MGKKKGESKSGSGKSTRRVGRSLQTLHLKDDEGAHLNDVGRQEPVPEPESTNVTVQGNALSGLLSHYMDTDDNDSDENDDGNVPNKTTKIISNEVDDFLKEINAISSKMVRATDNQTPNERVGSNHLVKAETNQSALESSLQETVNVSSSDALPWQACLDESSGYTYYWNVKTNEVTWECPKELKPYTKTIPDQAAECKAKSNIGEPVGHAHNVEQKTKPVVPKPEMNSRIVPITSYGEESSSEEETPETDSKVAGNGASCTVAAVHQSTHNVMTENAETSGTASDHKLASSPEIEVLSSTTDNQVKEGGASQITELRGETLKLSSASSSTNDADILEVKVLVSHNGSNSQRVQNPVTNKASHASDLSNDELQEPDSTTVKQSSVSKAKEKPNPLPSKSHREDEQALPNLTSTEKAELETHLAHQTDINNTTSIRRHSYNLQYNPDNTGDERPSRPGFGFSDDAVLPPDGGSGTNKRSGSFERGGPSTSVSFVKAETLDFNEINQKCSTEGKEDKDSHTIDNDDSFDDIEIIERELDKALERTLNSTSSSNKVKGVDSARVRNSKKRSSNTELQTFEIKKRTKYADQDVEQIARTVLGKLEHFGITIPQLSQLQKILYETEIRLKDWKEGSLASDYVLKHLKAADDALSSYEESLAPQFRTSHRDRSLKATGAASPRKSAGDKSLEKESVTPHDLVCSTDSSSALVSSTTNKRNDADDASLFKMGSEESFVVLPPASPNSTRVPPSPPPLPPCPPPQPESPPPPPPDSTDTEDEEAKSVFEIAPPPSPFRTYFSTPMAYSVNTCAPDDNMESELVSFYSNLDTNENTPVTSMPSTTHPEVEQNDSNEPVHPTDYQATEVNVDKRSPSPVSQTTSSHGKRRLKKTKIAPGLALKKKNIPSLVQKWQRIQKEQLAEDDMETSSSSRTSNVDSGLYRAPS